MIRRFLAILALTTLLPACANHPAPDSGAGPRTVTVGRTDTGRLISLHAGDRLVVSLDTPTSMQWQLLSYPKDVLARLAGYATTGRFEFSATSTGTGTGRITLMIRPSCGNAGGPPCPPAGDIVDGTGGMPPTRPITFDVSVT